jgi:NAD-specific glutamate dehydrogenase
LGAASIQALSASPPGFRERGLHQLAVFQRDHAPAAGGEDLVEAAEHAVGRGRVEALAVIVDDPPAIADVVLGRLDQAFVDIALVELGIAHQRDHAAGVGRVHHAVRDR